MPSEVIPAGGCDGVELVVWQRMSELAAGSCEGIVETVVGIIHLVHLEHRFQATFIETGIVGYEGNGGYQFTAVVKWQLIRKEHIGNLFFQLLPYIREYRRIIRIALAESMHPLTEITVVVRFRLDKTIECVRNLTITYHNHPNRADA